MISRQRGQQLAEYALVLGLISMAVLGLKMLVARRAYQVVRQAHSLIVFNGIRQRDPDLDLEPGSSKSTTTETSTGNKVHTVVWSETSHTEVWVPPDPTPHHRDE